MSILEMQGPISKLSTLVSHEIASSSTPDQFLKKAGHAIQKVPNADARAVQHHLDCSLHEYSSQVYWLFSFVSSLHKLMSHSSTSLHDAIMREMIIDDVSGTLLIMCHNAETGRSRTIDFTQNATLQYVYNSISVRDSIQMGGSNSVDEFDTSLHGCKLSLNSEVSERLQVLMGIPNTYMKRMVESLETLIEGGKLAPVSSARLEYLHGEITGLAAEMCERSLSILIELRALAIEHSHTRIMSKPYKNAFLIL